MILFIDDNAGILFLKIRTGPPPVGYKEILVGRSRVTTVLKLDSRVTLAPLHDSRVTLVYLADSPVEE